MNDIEFIETLKQKRNACDYSQSRLAQELQISRQNLNEIENGKTKASMESGLLMSAASLAHSPSLRPSASALSSSLPNSSSETMRKRSSIVHLVQHAGYGFLVIIQFTGQIHFRKDGLPHL